MLWRWALRATILVAVLAAWGVDARLKSGDSAGFVPAKVDWVAYAPRFGTVWSGITRTTAFRAFNKQWPVPYNDAVVYVRASTGVRPTSIRWSTWLGKTALIFGSEKGVGWCVRPGLLVRGADFVNRLVSNPAAPNVYRFGPYCYAWRDGFLVFSTARDVVDDTLAGVEFSCPETLARDEVYVGWQRSPQGFAVLSAREALPLRIALDIPPGQNGKLTGPWPENPFLEVRSTDDSSVSGASALLRYCFNVFPGWAQLRDVVPDAAASLPLAEQAGKVAESGLALFKSPTQDRETPVAALRFRFAETAPAAPFPGNGSAPMTAIAAGPFWYLSPSGDLLKVLSAHAEAEADTEDTFVCRLEWNRAGKELEEHFRFLLQQDETLQEQIEGAAIPATQAVGSLGLLHLEGRRSGNRLVFSGQLAVVPPETNDKAASPQGEETATTNRTNTDE